MCRGTVICDIAYIQTVTIQEYVNVMVHQSVSRTIIRIGHCNQNFYPPAIISAGTEVTALKTYQSSPAPNLSGPVVNRNQVNLPLQPVYDKDMRDDKALERVLYCLRELADNCQPKEVMMVISQLQFGKYLGHPSYAATATLLPRPRTLPEHLLQQNYHEGDFDVLIIHRQHGLFTLEIKSVGANFSKLKMTEQQEDNVVIKKVKEAVKQLSKSDVVLKHLTSDLTDNNIRKNGLSKSQVINIPYGNDFGFQSRV